MGYQAPIEEQLQNLSLNDTLTPKEQEVLASLKKEDFSNLTEEQSLTLLAQTLDIVYAFNYDKVVTLNEHTSESGWTIIKLSSTLAGFSEYSAFNTLEDKVKAVVISSLR